MLGETENPHAARLSSFLLVCAQLILLAGILLASMKPPRLPWLMLLAAGAALGVWAVASMGCTRLRIVPELHPESRLILSGPYRWIRHPMYTGLMLLVMGLIGNHPTWTGGLLALALLAVLVVKMRREERLLEKKFPEYKDYRRRSSRLIPGVY